MKPYLKIHIGPSIYHMIALAGLEYDRNGGAELWAILNDAMQGAVSE